MYLDVVLDGGLIGLTLLVAFLFTALLSAWGSYVGGRPGAAFTFGLVCAVIVHGGGESLFKLPTFEGFMLYSSIFRLLWIEGDSATPTPQRVSESASPVANAGPAEVGLE